MKTKMMTLALSVLAVTLAACGEEGGAPGVSSAETRSSNPALMDVTFISPARGWAVGESGLLLETTDGGGTWTSRPLATNAALMAVTFTDAIHGWIVGADGCVFASSNAGDSWTPQTSGTTGLLEDVVFTDALTGWIVGADGLLLQTADGGATWTSRTLGTTLGLHAVAFAGSTGLLVGDSGVIFRTIDGGATWNFQAASGKALYDVRFLDRQTVRAVGVEGQILVSFNQGQNWITEVSGTDADLLSLCAGEGWTYWIAGARGTILRTSNDGFTWQAQDSGTTGTFHAITLDGMDRIRAVGDAGSSFVNNP